jgi:hypothetical protein
MVDRATVARILDGLYAQAAFLPRPDELVQVVVDASESGLDGVVAALWPIGAISGAKRGLGVAAAALRDETAGAFGDPSLDARGRWVVAGMVEAVRELAASPHPERCYAVEDSHGVVAYQNTLAQAVTVGLVNSWRAGHFDAADRAVSCFMHAVVDLVGPERLATTFLAPALPAYALMEELGYRAYRRAEADRENPSTVGGQGDHTKPLARSPGIDRARGFAVLRRIDPRAGGAGEPRLDLRRSTGPDHRRPRR